MTQDQFNDMLSVAIAQGIGGGTYISRWAGEEIDSGIAKLLLPGGITTPELADLSVTWPKLAVDARPIRKQLFDNAWFANKAAIIDQRGGYIVPAGTAYYQVGVSNPTVAGTLTAPARVTRFSSVNNAPIFVLNGVEYFSQIGTAVRGYCENGYAFDRWFLQNYTGTGSVEIEDGYVTLTAKNNDGIRQHFEQSLAEGDTYTVSVLTADNQLLTRTFVITDSVQVISYEGTIWRMAASRNSVYPVITYNQESPQTIDIVAVYLEQSDHQTAFRTDANGKWIVNERSDYWLEWLKCRQYFRVIKGPTLLTGVRDYSVAQRVGVPITDGPMRAKPTPVLQGKSNIAAIGGNGSGLTITSALPGSKDHFLLSGTQGQITINGPVAIYCNDDIWLDANL